MSAQANVPSGWRGVRTTRVSRIAATGAAAVVGRGAVVLAWLAVVPIGLKYLGPERYGMWATVTSLAALVQFSDLGLGFGFLNGATRAIAADDRAELRRQTTTAFVSITAVSALALVVFVLLDNSVAWASLFRVTDGEAVGEARQTVQVAIVAFVTSQVLSIIPQLYFAKQQGYLVHAGTGIAAIVSVAAVWCAAQLDLGTPGLTAAITVPPIVSTTILGLVLFGRGDAPPKPSFGSFSIPVAKGLLRHGLQFFAIQLSMAIAFAADTLIVTQLRGPQAAAEYAVVARLFLVPLGVVGAILTPLWPAYGEAITVGDIAWIRSVFRRSVGLVILLATVLSGVLALAGPDLIHRWVDGAVAPSHLLIVGFCAWVLMSALGNVCAMLLNGVGEIRLQAIFAVAMAAVNLVLSIWLTSLIGPAGAIWGTVLSYVSLVLVPMTVYVPRVLAKLTASDAGVRAA
jgi:O-antigen/teichoic acid export membrane protein